MAAPISLNDVAMPVATIGDTSEKREKLAVWLFDLIAASISARQGFDSICDDVQSMYFNERNSDLELTGEGQEVTQCPIMQPRIDVLCAQLNQILLNQDTYFLCETGDDNIASNIEKTVHSQFKLGSYPKAIRQATTRAALTNHAIFRISFEVIPKMGLADNSADLQIEANAPYAFAGIRVDSFYPNDFVMAPCTLDGISSAVVVGHRFYHLFDTIKERMEQGFYFKQDDNQLNSFIPSSPTERNDRVQQYSEVSDAAFLGYKATEQIECFDLVFRYAEEGKRLKWYKAVFAYKEKFVLSVEEWPYSRPPYFNAGLIENVREFWEGRSVARNLMPLDSEYNNIHAAIYNGTMDSASPPIIGPRIDGEEFTQYGRNDYIESDGQVQPWSPASRFNPQGLMQAEADVERHADLTLGTSTNSLGGEEEKQTTATQTQAINQGASTRLTDYISVFTSETPQMVAFACELLYDQWGFWTRMPGMTGTEIEFSKADLLKARDWEINGTSPASSPAARRAEIAQLAAVANDPAYRINKYKLGTLMLSYSTIPGAKSLQDETIPETAPGIPSAQPEAPTGMPPLPFTAGQPGQGISAKPEERIGAPVKPFGGGGFKLPTGDSESSGPNAADLRAAG